jgi:hypothetical protein
MDDQLVDRRRCLDRIATANRRQFKVTPGHRERIPLRGRTRCGFDSRPQ